MVSSKHYIVLYKLLQMLHYIIFSNKTIKPTKRKVQESIWKFDDKACGICIVLFLKRTRQKNC